MEILAAAAAAEEENPVLILAPLTCRPLTPGALIEPLKPLRTAHISPAVERSPRRWSSG